MENFEYNPNTSPLLNGNPSSRQEQEGWGGSKNNQKSVIQYENNDDGDGDDEEEEDNEQLEMYKTQKFGSIPSQIPMENEKLDDYLKFSGDGSGYKRSPRAKQSFLIHSPATHAPSPNEIRNRPSNLSMLSKQKRPPKSKTKQSTKIVTIEDENSGNESDGISVATCDTNVTSEEDEEKNTPQFLNGMKNCAMGIVYDARNWNKIKKKNKLKYVLTRDKRPLFLVVWILLIFGILLFLLWIPKKSAKNKEFGFYRYNK